MTGSYFDSISAPKDLHHSLRRFDQTSAERLKNFLVSKETVVLGGWESET